MTIIEALILGIIQGLTEFLPISSSGHLVIGQELLGISVPGNEFEVIVHMGTLFSVLIVFWRDIYELITSLNTKKTQRYIIAVLIGTFPAMIVGLLLKDTIGQAFDDIRVVATALLFTGFVLLSTKFIKTKQNEVTIGKGFVVGVTQALAIIPGISRSGITISTGMFLGIAPEKAAKFSFLLAIPAIAGAGLLTVLETASIEVSTIPFVVGIAGFISSLIIGWISLKVLIGLIKTGKFYWFGIYCILIGLISWMI